jgi:hypothetical protein
MNFFTCLQMTNPLMIRRSSCVPVHVRLFAFAIFQMMHDPFTCDSKIILSPCVCMLVSFFVCDVFPSNTWSIRFWYYLENLYSIVGVFTCVWLSQLSSPKQKFQHVHVNIDNHKIVRINHVFVTYFLCSRGKKKEQTDFVRQEDRRILLFKKEDIQI